MYSRIYPANEGIPPNYKGNAFDKAPEPQSPPQPVCAEEPVCEAPPAPKAPDRNCESENSISSIFSGRNGRKFDLDDLILGALIVMLLNSHADDELLLILVLLFVVGL